MTGCFRHLLHDFPNNMMDYILDMRNIHLHLFITFGSRNYAIHNSEKNNYCKSSETVTHSANTLK